MDRMKMFSRLSVFMLLVLAMVSDAQAGKLYRYKNAEGKLVISTSIPPERAAKGYEILNRNGRLLQTISPHVVKSNSELVAEKIKLSQQQEDEFLLKSYSTVAEIEAAWKRKLDSLNRDIALIEDSLQKTNMMRKQKEHEAANMQRSGKEVSAVLLAILSDIEQKELETQQVLQSRLEERKRENTRYTGYIERFRYLSR